ncbi:hypothetical protein PYW07_013357 [Mythimna separata]|uniref:Mannosyl-oligosaccharide glucosidase n=1 Tax=Mythimna separata TaxID=271217 RepID=A0AAD8DJX5_MYTSE|nr:hypothetical protein PYW07_013357 [Mythimna separata]
MTRLDHNKNTLGYLETRVNTPFDDDKVVKETGLQIPERYWGTYRPGVYMGLKSREPRSPVFGMMWYELSASRHKGIRHWCDQNDQLATYGWLRHDGVTFGEQLITDLPHNITTSFVKTPGGEHGGHWTARINVTTKGHAKVPFMLIWYAALDESLGPAAPHSRLWYEDGSILGHTPQLHNFRVNFVPHKGKLLYTSYSEAHAPGLHLLKEKFYSLLKIEKSSMFGKLAVLGPDDELNIKEKDINFVPVQMLVETPFSIDIVYTTEDLSTPPLKGEKYTKALEAKKMQFDLEFEEKFKLDEKGYPPQDVAIARAALSNMVGGVGYFFGASRVQSQYTKEPVPYWRAPLYTGVPSRAALSNMVGGVGYFFGASRVQSQYTKEPVPYWRAPLYTGVPSRAALSNMVGGVGYFFGASRVQSQYTKEPVPYWRAPLYTGVPSRAALSNMVGGVGYFFGASRVQSQYTKEPVPYWRAPLYTGVPSR